MKTLIEEMVSPDPYDLWASPLGVEARRAFYEGSYRGRFLTVALGLCDWLLPELARKVLRGGKRVYPIVVAHETLYRTLKWGKLSDHETEALLQILRTVAVRDQERPLWAWGLGFPWMSKNGLYGPTVPFVTHTPYVMEALIVLARVPAMWKQAMDLFHGTWNFLQSLRVMYQGNDLLALSYAPCDEPRIVVNANSYAAFAYALHAIYGRDEVLEEARVKAERLARWVVRQQQENGSWFYYADYEPGNFIDCFHSCFVVKNLLKVKRLLPELDDLVKQAIEKGWEYIQARLFDDRTGLCRRFAVRAQRDPFRWDLYDQAEFLGLLVDFGELERAADFAQRVQSRFRKGDDWYCRIDILGRRWGRNFLRWGIVPFWYHQARLERALEGAL